MARAGVVQHLLTDLGQNPRGSASGLGGPQILRGRRPLNKVHLAVVHRVLLHSHTMQISVPACMGHRHSRVFRTFLVFSALLVFRAPGVLRVLSPASSMRAGDDHRMTGLLDVVNLGVMGVSTVMPLGLRVRMGDMSDQRAAHDHHHYVNSRSFPAVLHSSVLSLLGHSCVLTAINGLPLASCPDRFSRSRR